MYNKEIKIAISSALFILSVLCIYPLKIYWLTPILVILILFIVLTIFRNENNLVAFYFLRKNEPGKSLQALDRVKYPEKLIKSQEAYHYYLRGLILSQKEVLKSEKYFLKALNIGLRMDTDRAVCKLNLAAIALQKKKKQQAIQLISEAKKLDKQGLLKEQISILNGQMKFI